jgi:hypothetical protein
VISNHLSHYSFFGKNLTSVSNDKECAYFPASRVFLCLSRFESKRERVRSLPCILSVPVSITI